jgi:DNA-binding NtrC family response regulator
MAMLHSGDPLPDVVLLDDRLPGAMGFDLLSTIRTQSPASAVVMMSADQTTDTIAEAMRQGAFTVMQKPFDMKAIEPAVLIASQARHPAPQGRRSIHDSRSRDCLSDRGHEGCAKG